ncbi:MAG: SDR family oxidoreductase [Betaproteobacteria bacterium]|nr:SDR family oxidoreductase [Betaproteobacteria bacterium]
MDLNGKIVLITGGAGGIGAGTARRLAKRGAIVWAVDVDDASGRELEKELGPPHRYRHHDVTDAAAWKSLVAEMRAAHGGIDIAFLNAGIMFRARGAPALGDDLIDLVTRDFDRYRQVMAINTDGALLGALHCLPAMGGRGRDGGGAHIVVNSSDSGLRVHPWDLAYGMSKRALVSMLETLAPLYVKRGVTMTALCPAGVDSGISPSDFKERRIAQGQDYASTDFAAAAVETILHEGKPGEVWMARHQDHGFWVYPLPAVPAQVDAMPGKPRIHPYVPLQD